jgi:hypothetical protein
MSYLSPHIGATLTPTPQQQTIIDHVIATEGLTLVKAIAGAGKTSLLVSLAHTLKPTNGLYLCYNKVIATEAQRKFPKAVLCCTTHSLAYKPTVTAHKLHLGPFSYRNLPSFIPYERRCELVSYLREFFLSSHLDLQSFITKDEVPITPDETSILNTIIQQMESGSIECTHDFYLKYFHILLATNHLTYPPFDFIALDEAGDLNPVTLAIFNLLPSPRKIMVGDPSQNIYSFNHTINCFSVMADKGTTLPMSQSFRVATEIAQPIESFCKRYLDPNMEFKGITVTDPTIHTSGYIARTNASLISKMMYLNSMSIPYGLTRSPDQIFQLPRLLCSLRKGVNIPLPEFKHLQHDLDDYYDDPELQQRHRTLLGYLKHRHKDDIQLSTGISIVLRYGMSGILSCYNEAKKHHRTDQPLLLGTAHSMKG